MEWKDLTVVQAQYIHTLTKSIVDEHTGFEAEIKALSFLTGTPEAEIDKWELPKYREEIQALDFMYQPIPIIKAKRKFTINGQRYIVNYNIKKISYGVYNEAMNFNKSADGVIGNLHNLMAAIVHPVNMYGLKQKKDMSVVAESMLQAPFMECYAVSKFYYQVYKEFLKTIPDHLEKELQEKGMSKEQSKEAVEILYQAL